MVLVLLSAVVERVGVSRMQDFFVVFLADPGKGRVCSTNNAVHELIKMHNLNHKRQKNEKFN